MRWHIIFGSIPGMAVTLSQNEISARAAKFADDWKDTVREEAEAQSFLIDFFHVLGVSRKRVAIFEHKVKCADGGSGYIDLFWKGHILIEMKTRGKDLSKAYEQAKRYADSLAHHELPKAILVCDFENWHFYDLGKDGQPTTFSLSELPQYIHLFHFLAGYEQREYQEEDPVNVQAAELLGKLHDRLKAIGYIGHPLEVYLVRLLFCLFAEDTGIFRKDSFRSYILNCTAEDGRDLAPLLAQLFQVLNTPEKSRLCTRDASVTEFPYVNGGLFAEFLPMPAFDSDMRQAVLDCCALDWSRISPAIFGSMFQSVMNAEERRALGAHYTSERNILKLINPLFMDGLREEFESIQHDKSNRKASRLQAFHKKLTELNFLDPACGCGNFLVVAYRELRRLELSVIAEREKLEASGTGWMLSANDVCLVNVNQFYGIEIEEFPAQIAQVAMWLMDHQMNIEVGNYFGEAFARIPLTASATIVCGNALQLDWESVVPKDKLSYILGNPPFIGARMMDQGSPQKKEVEQLFGDIKDVQDLDYVTCWYKKSARYIQDTQIEVAFVSTNSICQGAQVPILWGVLLKEHGIKLNFAHQTFKWNNEARGKAAVYCVIVGFSLNERKVKQLYSYPDIQGEPMEKQVDSISPYLHAGACIYVEAQKKPLCNVPEMKFGSQPRDGGLFVLTPQEREEILTQEPELDAVIRPFIGAEEFIKGKSRYCIWLHNEPFSTIRNSKILKERIAAVESFRLSSKAKTTQGYAKVPALFAQIAHPYSDYLIIPSVSSENRLYIPIGFLTERSIASNAVQIIPNATLYHFGVLTSSMHMAWMRTVAGRLKSDYRYSKEIVYNTFPWPECGEKERNAIDAAAAAVLAEREKLAGSSLAELYDPVWMKTTPLYKAHLKLDSAVEKAYGRKFADDAERVAFLFEKYTELTK